MLGTPAKRFAPSGVCFDYSAFRPRNEMMKEPKKTDQDLWHEKIKELQPPSPDENGHDLYSNELDEPARKWLANELRELADHIEHSKHYPQVFGCHIPEDGLKGKGILFDYRITMSHLWPG
jgi:hypothetical protein